MPQSLSQLATTAGLHPRVFATLVIVLMALVVGTIARVVGGRRDPEKRRQRLASLGTWWGLFAVLSAVVWAGTYAIVLMFAGLSWAGLREYRHLVGSRIEGSLWWYAVAAVPIHYAFVARGDLGPVWTVIPVWVLVALLVRLVVGEEIPRFLETAGTVFLGLMILVYLLSHAALVVTLPLVAATEGAGPMGMFLYLVLLTESNDIAQALWGRKFGRHKITPHISPHKTWEGFLLGMATTLALAVVLAPLLTPLSDCSLRVGDWFVRIRFLPAVVAGLLIAAGGFFGDVTISAIKREVGVKDSGTLLPGMGGLLDRIDSLTFTGPLFFYFVLVLCV